MAVPAHDTRDYEFAKTFDLPIIEVDRGWGYHQGSLTPTCRDGILVNSDFLNGLRVARAKTAIIDCWSKKGLGERKVNYKLRDWVFSRQRYWGEPIPVVHCRALRHGTRAGGTAAGAPAQRGKL
jgi:leucyl-tRNA synthetase